MLIRFLPMLIRFLLIPLPAALALLGLQLKYYFGCDFVALLVAAPAYAIAENVLPLMFHPDGLDVLGLGLLGWSSLVLAPWWIPSWEERHRRNKLILICLPLSFALQMGTLAWKVWSLFSTIH